MGGKIVYSRRSGDRILLHVMNADGSGDRELSGQSARIQAFADWSPDGKQIALLAADSLNRMGGPIRIVQADGRAVRILQLPFTWAAMAIWNPDGKRLAVQAGELRINLWITDLEGKSRRQINPPDTSAIHPFWSRDGKRIGYTRLTGLLSCPMLVPGRNGHPARPADHEGSGPLPHERGWRDEDALDAGRRGLLQRRVGRVMAFREASPAGVAVPA